MLIIHSLMKVLFSEEKGLCPFFVRIWFFVIFGFELELGTLTTPSLVL